MEIRSYPRGDGLTHLALIGVLDISMSSMIDTDLQRLVSGAQQPAMIDVSQVTGISSLGMGLLTGLAVSLRRRGMGIVLIHPTPIVHEALTIAAVDRIIPIVDSEEQAEAVLREGPTEV